MKKIDPNGPLAATALRLAAEMLQAQSGAPVRTAEAIAERVNGIGVLAESLIRSFVVAVEKSPMRKA